MGGSEYLTSTPTATKHYNKTKALYSWHKVKMHNNPIYLEAKYICAKQDIFNLNAHSIFN
jgi:hypothetical protein